MPTKVNNEYRKLRAAVIRRGSNLRRWAIAEGVPVSTVYEAARGTRAGVEAIRIRTKLEEFAYAK